MSTSAARPRVAVLVPVHDGEALLGDCLGAVLATKRVAELLVVDDASFDASYPLVEKLAKGEGGRLRALRLPRNLGFAGAVNRGMTLLLGGATPPDVVVLLNQDCIVHEGWLEPLLAALEDASVAAAGARLLEADGRTLQHAGARVEANGLTTHFGRGSEDAAGHREPRDCDYVCGALFALRSVTWRRVGAFDEGYAPAYFEEVDWCLRARAAGLRIVYEPRSEARHLEASTSRAGSRLFLERYHRSRLRFVARHLFGPRWLVAELRWLLAQRSWKDVAPVLAAYGRLPRLLLERRAARAMPGLPVTAENAR